MENINIKDFLVEVDKAALWLTERRTFPVGLNIGVAKPMFMKKDDKQSSCEVLKKLIEEAPDTYVREWRMYGEITEKANESGKIMERTDKTRLVV
jgi:hypothetical protein